MAQAPWMKRWKFGPAFGLLPIALLGGVVIGQWRSTGDRLGREPRGC